MSDRVRCKVTCTANESNAEGNNIHFLPVYDGSPENKEFFRFTPSLHLTFYTVNKAAAEKIEVGKEYYVDLIPAQ